MDAIVTAGGVPEPDELLYPATQGKSKCLLQVHGKSLVQWVLDALAGAGTEHVVVMGLPEDTALHFPGDMRILPSQGGIVDNIRAGAKELVHINPEPRPLLLVSGDLPCIDAHMINWISQQAYSCPADLYYSVVARDVMETTFPGSRRSYIKLQGLEICGGDMMIVHSQSATGHLPMIDRLVKSRKNAVKQASILGFDLLLMLLLGKLSLEKAEKMISKRLKIKGKVLVSPFAEVGMDVDKPNQLELVKQYFASKKKAEYAADN